MDLDELRVYRVAMEIGERVWALVEPWEWFAKNTVGRQWVRAGDSMAANLSEGYGRFFYKENRQFTYYARGSLFETTTWLEKAHSRGLVGEADYTALRKDLESLAVRLNNYIRSIGKSPQAVHEDYGAYEVTPTKEIELPPPMMKPTTPNEVEPNAAITSRKRNSDPSKNAGRNNVPQAPNDAAQPPITARQGAMTQPKAAK